MKVDIYMRESRDAGNQTSSRIKDKLKWNFGKPMWMELQ